MIRHPDGTREVRYGTTAEELFTTVAEFRRVPNLFEILGYDYWHLNYGYLLPGYVSTLKPTLLLGMQGRQVAVAPTANGGLLAQTLDLPAERLPLVPVGEAGGAA